MRRQRGRSARKGRNFCSERAGWIVSKKSVEIDPKPMNGIAHRTSSGWLQIGGSVLLQLPEAGSSNHTTQGEGSASQPHSGSPTSFRQKFQRVPGASIGTTSSTVQLFAVVGVQAGVVTRMGHVQSSGVRVTLEPAAGFRLRVGAECSRHRDVVVELA